MCVFWLIYSFQQLSEFGTIIILIYFTDKETEDQPTYKKRKKNSPRFKGGKAEELGFDSGLAASCIRTHNYYTTILHPLVVKNPPANCRRCKRNGFDPWIRKIPWRRAWQPTPLCLPGKSHGQRSLAGYSP